MTTSAFSPSGSSQNLGIGNLAKIKAQRGMESLAIIDLFDAQDMVAEEVNQALARLQSAAVRVFQADRALRTGIITFNGTVEGLKQTSRFGDVLVLISRPQEAVYALQLLKKAFDEYFTTVAEYNRAQFELFHALGYPAREVAELRPPGDGPAGGHGAAGLPAPGGQRAAPGHAMNASQSQGRFLGSVGEWSGIRMKERSAWPSILARGLAPVLGRARTRARPSPRPPSPASTSPIAAAHAHAAGSGVALAVGGVLRHRALRESGAAATCRTARRPVLAGRQSPGESQGGRDLPAPCRAVPSPTARRARVRPTGGDAPITPGHRSGAQSRAVRADRPPLPDQPRHRPAALRRPAPDRRRGAGQGLGRRGRVDPGQGPLDSRPQHRPSTTSATTAAARTSTRAS